MKNSHELKNLRNKREKHFLQKDGTVIAHVYSDDIHYLKNGTYEEIDNTLRMHGDFIANVSNAFKASFRESYGKLCRIERDGHTLSMSLKNEQKVSPKYEGKEVIYENILDGVDVRYTLYPTKIKEDIILKEKIPNEIVFEIKTDLELNIKDGMIQALSGTEVIFELETPYMMDSLGRKNNDIYYELKDHLLILKLDQDWLKTAVFPVTIDPTITSSGQGKNVYDTYIFPGDTNIDRNSMDHLNIGVERVNGKDIVNRALLKFDLPTIGTGSQIISAEASLIGYLILALYPKSDTVTVHRVTQDWNETTANWNTMHDKYDTRIEDYNPVYMSLNIEGEVKQVKYNYFNITDLVKKWYSGLPNYGILLKAQKEVYNSEFDLAQVFSKNNRVIGDNSKPELVIHYKNQNGLESYMDYQQQALSDGTLHSNLYNGNLVGTFDIGKTISGRFPAQLSLIYNTNDVILNNNYGYGLGFQLNFHQTLKEVPIETFSTLEYKDADGTLHYFYQGKDLGNDYPEDPSNPKVKRDPNTYYDEDGLSLTIKRVNQDFIMTDNDGNTSKFIKIGDRYYLVEITDTEENKIQIQYDSQNRIVKVIDGNEEEITLEYGDHVITVVSPNETVTLSYLNHQLVNINTKNGTTIIDYNSKKIISKVIDINGKSIGYEYYDMIPYRIKQISEYGIQNQLGNTLEFVYGFNTTTLKDRNGYSTYTFNNQGNTIGVTSLNQNEELNDAYGKTFQCGEKNPYTTSFGTMNKIMSENPTIKVVKNYLENSSFEQSENPFSGGTIVETESVVGKHSLHITGLVTKSIVVPKGKNYTFSAYIKTSENCEIRLSYLNSSNEEVHVSKIIEPNTLFERHSVTLEYPSNGSNFKIEMIGNNAYLDNVQLEEGEVANLYNYVDNSDFSKGVGDFKAIISYPEEATSINPLQVVTLSNGNKALKWHTEPGWSQYLQKHIPISGKKGDIYTVYFWYKNTGIEKATPGLSQGKVLLQFDYINPDPSCVFSRGDYSANNTEWHFFEETFMADYDYNGLNITLFDSHANDLYVTNFALYQPIASDATYFYDDNGNMTHMSDPKSGPKELIYDKNNQLIGMMDVKGSNFVYEYDNVIKDRVLKGISGTGISNEIEYDSFGNPMVTRITNKNKRSNIEGIYYIRKKGTKQYMTPDFVKNNLKLTESTCSHYAFTLTKQDELYKIAPTVYPTMSIYEIDHKLYLSKTKATLFELQKNQNGSYSFIEPNSKLKITDQDGLLILDNEGEFYLEEQDSRLFIENVAQYTEDGKFIKQTKDTLGRITNYDIDPNTGLTNSVTDPKLISTDYTYNNKEQITKVKKKDHEVIYQYNHYDLLSKIIHGTKEYNFLYDEFLNTKQIQIGNQVLITNHYEANNGNLESSTYGNNQTISYLYDDFDRISKITKMNDTYLYYYDNLGNLSKVKTNDHQYEYYYDTNKRLIDYYDDLFHIGYTYNKSGNVKQKRI